MSGLGRPGGIRKGDLHRGLIAQTTAGQILFQSES